MEKLTEIQEKIIELSETLPEIDWGVVFTELDRVLHTGGMTEQQTVILMGTTAFAYKETKKEFLQNVTPSSQTKN
jgi:hypothetical protein